MEPKILASPQNSAAPDSAAWSARTEEQARQEPNDGNGDAGESTIGIGVRAKALSDGASIAVLNGGDGYVSGRGNGGASTWPAFVPASRGSFARVLPIYEAPAESGFYLRFGKRLVDVLGAAAGLVLSSPVLLLAAILIKLESRGPIFYRSLRIGRGARPFTFLKLRSMVEGADQHRHTLSHLNETDGPVFKMARDPRVTRVGRLLRVTSIDEIPQLWNVLRGEMSLVGPRPPLAEEVVQYEPWQLRRLDVLPGITCLWQISGRSRIGFQEWMRLDLEYIKHRSFWLDVKILIRTIPAVLSREGAY
jgi:lipopolysaccharide/colanic/teichoic acid biosynthesis glycosyltransferase